MIGTPELHQLTIYQVVQYFLAVQESLTELKGLFGPHDPWPPGDLDLEQNFIDLAWHQKEFELKRSFAYKIVRGPARDYLGCVYIEYSDHCAYDVQVFFWLRSRHRPRVEDNDIHDWLRHWLIEEGHAGSIAFPGRDILWADWPAFVSSDRARHRS